MITVTMSIIQLRLTLTLLFDKNFILVDAAYRQLDDGAEQVGTETKAPHDYLVREVTVTEPGYAYIFLSNENLKQVDVHFDDVTITHTHSNIVAGADYYPFGLAMENREITDEPYRWGYQGQFSEKDLTTGMQEFELRNYDARIGRWTTTDPYGQYASPYLGMGNVPHMSVDANGGWSWLGAGIGAAVGGLSAYIASDGDWRATLLGGLGGGLIGGAIFRPSRAIVEAGSSQAATRLSTFGARPPISSYKLSPWRFGLNVALDLVFQTRLIVEPPYMRTARQELGVTEIQGDQHNERVLEYLRTTGDWWNTDETPWCSGFVNWTLGGCNIRGTNDARALSWDNWGTSLDRPALGSVAIIDNGNGTGHVGFVAGTSGDNIVLLGGNQSNQVRYSSFSRNRIINYVVPRHYSIHMLQFNLPNYNDAGNVLDITQTR